MLNVYVHEKNYRLHKVYPSFESHIIQYFVGLSLQQRRNAKLTFDRNINFTVLMKMLLKEH